MATSPRDHAGGFTLIELVIAMAILGLVLVPMVMAFTAGLRTQAVTDELAFSSQAPRLLAAYLTTDVQSANQVVLASAPTCPAPVGSTGRLGLVQIDATGTTTGAVTWSQRGTAPDVQLLRTACGTAGSGTVTVATRLETAVVVACSPSATCATGSAVTVTVDPLAHPPTSLTTSPRVGG